MEASGLLAMDDVEAAVVAMPVLALSSVPMAKRVTIEGATNCDWEAGWRWWRVHRHGGFRRLGAGNDYATCRTIGVGAHHGRSFIVR